MLSVVDGLEPTREPLKGFSDIPAASHKLIVKVGQRNRLDQSIHYRKANEIIVRDEEDIRPPTPLPYSPEGDPSDVSWYRDQDGRPSIS